MIPWFIACASEDCKIRTRPNNVKLHTDRQTGVCMFQLTALLVKIPTYFCTLALIFRTLGVTKFQ